MDIRKVVFLKNKYLINVTSFFNLSELKCKCGCDLTILDCEFLECLENLRNIFGFPIKINSGYRCPQHNRNIGGAQYSYHTRGMACDIALPVDHDEASRLIIITQKNFPAVRVYPNFIHADVGPKRRW